MSYSGEGFLMFAQDVTGKAVPVAAATTTVTAGVERATLGFSFPFGFQLDNFTAPGPGQVIAIPSGVKSYSIVVKGVAVEASNWNVVLEGSLNAIDYTTILLHRKSTGNGVLLATETVLVPSVFFRARCVSLNLGPATSINVTILGMD